MAASGGVACCRSAVAALQFGAIHRGVGIAGQGFQVLAVVGIESNANAHRHEAGLAVQFERGADGVADLVGDAEGFVHVVHIMKQGQELVAPLAGEQVAGAQAAAHAARRFDQQGVTGCVAELVIDLLEVIQIEEQQRKAGLVTVGNQHAVVHLFHEHGPVCETGQRIVGGQVADCAPPTPSVPRCR